MHISVFLLSSSLIPSLGLALPWCTLALGHTAFHWCSRSHDQEDKRSISKSAIITICMRHTIQSMCTSNWVIFCPLQGPYQMFGVLGDVALIRSKSHTVSCLRIPIHVHVRVCMYVMCLLLKFIATCACSHALPPVFVLALSLLFLLFLPPSLLTSPPLSLTCTCTSSPMRNIVCLWTQMIAVQWYIWRKCLYRHSIDLKVRIHYARMIWGFVEGDAK